MALVTRRDSGNQQVSRTRDPFSMFRDLLTWEPYDQRAVSTFNPRFEIKERADGFLFIADMPGVRDEDLDISLQNGVLTIGGTRLAEQRQENETYYAYEREYGSFSRSFALPDYADPDKVEGKLEHGVLTVTVGKRSEAKPRKVLLNKKS